MGGLYYPAGGLICDVINSDNQENGARCIAKPSEGSWSNIGALRKNEINFAILQENLQKDAYHGGGRFVEQEPFEQLRTVFTLYIEQFTILARADAGIKNLAGLKEKRVNIGLPGSGQYTTVANLLEHAGWKNFDFIPVSAFDTEKQSQALCEGDIDALIYIVGHPNRSITEATLLCQTNFVEIVGDELNTVLEKFPSFVPTYIPASYYYQGAGGISTFGTRVTFVTSTQVPEQLVYDLTRIVFENLNTLEVRHPLYKEISAESLLQGSVAPFHSGALRYYKEKGLIK